MGWRLPGAGGLGAPGLGPPLGRMAMLPTLLEGAAHQKPPMGGMVEGAIRPPAGKTEMAGLRAFLRSRCGSLKAAFHSLDVHSVGQVTSDDFVKGLQRLGYSEDATAIFHAIDTASSGLVSLRSFMHGIGAQSGDEEEASSHLLRSSFNSVGDSPSRSSHRASSEDAWRSARIPRHGSDGQLSRVSSPKHRHSFGDIDGPVAGSPKSSHGSERPPAVPAAPAAVATAELQAKIAWVEEQCSSEQKQRAEMENRLTQHLNTLVGVSISEQLDALRQQLIEERMQRQVEITSVRANLESIRSEIHKGDKGVESSSRHDEIVDSTARLSTRLEELSAELHSRLDALEVPAGVTRHVARDSDAMSEAASSPQSTITGNTSVHQDICRLQKQTAGLEEQLGSVTSRLEGLEGQGGGDREQTLALMDERLAAQRAVLFQEQSNALTMAKQAAECGVDLSEKFSKIEARLQEVGSAPLCSQANMETYVREKLDGLRQEWGAVIEKSGCRQAEDAAAVLPEVLSHVRGYMTERLEGMRLEWKALLEEEHERGCERAQVLGRTLGAEFERSITSQAIAEARAEACSAVSSMLDGWKKDNEIVDFPSQVTPEAKASVRFAEATESQEVPKTLRHLQGEVAGLFTLLKTEEEQRTDTQNSVALLRGDVDSLRSKLQERAPSRLEEVADRVTSLEAAFQHVGASAQSDMETIATKKMEQLCSDRLMAIDLGLARISSEVKQHGDGLQHVQRRQQVFSEEFLGRLQALVEKLDIQGLEHFGNPIRDPSRERSPGPGAAKRHSCPSLIGRPQAARSPVQHNRELPEAQAARSPSQQRLRLPEAPVEAARSPSQQRLRLPEAPVEVQLAKRAQSRDRSPCLCPEDDSIHRPANAGTPSAPCAVGCSTPSPTPMTPSAPSLPAQSPAATYRSIQAAPVGAMRQPAAGAARIPPQGSPTLRSRPPMVMPPHPVVSGNRIVSVPQSRLRCMSPGGGSTARPSGGPSGSPVANGATRLSSAPGKP